MNEEKHTHWLLHLVGIRCSSVLYIFTLMYSQKSKVTPPQKELGILSTSSNPKRA